MAGLPWPVMAGVTCPIVICRSASPGPPAGATPFAPSSGMRGRNHSNMSVRSLWLGHGHGLRLHLPRAHGRTVPPGGRADRQSRGSTSTARTDGHGRRAGACGMRRVEPAGVRFYRRRMGTECGVSPWGSRSPKIKQPPSWVHPPQMEPFSIRKPGNHPFYFQADPPSPAPASHHSLGCQSVAIPIEARSGRQ
jgi:hypothetical protein